MQELYGPLMRFGPFAVSTRTGELFRGGTKIKLQNQAFQVLQLLLENPGELVTRQELRDRLWPQNAYVDFDGGLNKAINSLRAALRDRLAKPRYIETLPQRGYRFVASVQDGTQTQSSRNSPPIHRQPGDRAIESLAVLPLNNLSGDPQQEYFSDGITDELISALARVGAFRVISRTSVMVYKHGRKTLPVIAQELGVDALVEGSVAREGDRIRVTAQLVDGTRDTPLWSGRYERHLRDVLRLQAEIASHIVEQIQKAVEPKPLSPTAARTLLPEAYEAFLKGNYFCDKMTPPHLEESIVCLQTAIDLDAQYAPAYAALSQVYFFLGLFGVRRPDESFPQAQAMARKALALDPTAAAAYNGLAVGHVFENWDWAAAEAEARRAVEINPADSVTHAHWADYLSIQGRHEEAISSFTTVLKLDPISRVFLGHLGLVLYRARRYQESIDQCRKALAIAPDYANAMWFLALSLEKTGQMREAIMSLEQAVGISKAPHYFAFLGRAYALAGERARAIQIADDLHRISQKRYVSPLDRAIVSAGLDDRDQTFAWLDEALSQRVFRMVELVTPVFDELRSDARWQELVRQIRLG